MQTLETRQIINAKALDFMLAGNANFTLKSIASGKRFTYKVRDPKFTNDAGIRVSNMFIVKVLTGTDNESDYRVIGKISNGVFSLTVKAREAGLTLNTPSVQAFKWVYEKLSALKTDIDVEIWHAGKCGRCGRKLTVPESIEAGYGPECINLIAGGVL